MNKKVMTFALALTVMTLTLVSFNLNVGAVPSTGYNVTIEGGANGVATD